MHGFLIIDKPKGITSFDVVYKVRKALSVKLDAKIKVGHIGTLDPLATGVLVLVIGQATKFIEYLVGLDKDYECEAIFGATSNTYDADGEIKSVITDELITNELVIDEITKNFLGKIQQVPPAYSAKWIDGKRAHSLARKGKNVNLKAVEIQVSSFELKSFDYPKTQFFLSVGSGTYVRSLIHDLGQNLACGAYVKELRRTRVGDFLLENAIGLEEFRNSENPEKSVMDLGEIMGKKFEKLNVNDSQRELLGHGREVEISDSLKEDFYSIFSEDAQFLGVAAKTSPTTIKFRKQFIV